MDEVSFIVFGITGIVIVIKQGRKRPLDTSKKLIERRERERKVEGDI